jgi:hypothetical protein
MTFRRVSVSILLLAAIFAGLAFYFLREPPSSADSIERVASYQDKSLLAQAWALPVARLYGPKGYLFQENPSICGPTSIADVLRSEGQSADPDTVLNHSGKWHVFGVVPFGLTLDEEAALLERETGKPVKELRDFSLDSFRAEMAQSNDPSRRVIVNFTRASLFGRGHGHFSPVLGYLPAEDLVFVGDVNAKYGPWLVPTKRLFDAQDTIDSSSHAKRGVLEVNAQ